MVLAAVVALGVLGGCAGLRQFPEKSDGRDAEVLADLDADYSEALADIYGDGTDAAADRARRNRYIETRLAVIDVQFQAFVRDLARGNAQADLLVALAGVGAGGAGALVSETASQILSAVSGGLAGGKAAYDKAVLYDNAMTALVAQMVAARQEVAARIFTRWEHGVEEYPLWLAHQDIAAYEFAGSLPGAIVATAEDAKRKADRAEEILQVKLPLLTREAFGEELGEMIERLDQQIADLSAANAKALVNVIEAEFPEVATFIEELYPKARRSADDGSKARRTLSFALEETVTTKAGAAIWERAIGSL